MSRALPGEHYCLLHQGNHSHYANHNCTVCKLTARVAGLEAQLAQRPPAMGAGALSFDQIEGAFPDGATSGADGVTVSAQWLHDFARAIYALRPAASGAGERVLYTCIGKGGEYELIGTAKGAGPLRKFDSVRIYRGGNGQLYFRTMDDFDSRMRRIDRSTANGAAGLKGGA